MAQWRAAYGRSTDANECREHRCSAGTQLGMPMRHLMHTILCSLVRWPQDSDGPPALKFSRKSRTASAKNNEDSTSSTPVAVVILILKTRKLELGSLHQEQRDPQRRLASRHRYM